MKYRYEQYTLDTLDTIRKETHENNIMLRQLCSYIRYIYSHRPSDEQNAFEQNVFANVVSELFDDAKNRFKGNNFKNK